MPSSRLVVMALTITTMTIVTTTRPVAGDTSALALDSSLMGRLPKTLQEVLSRGLTKEGDSPSASGGFTVSLAPSKKGDSPMYFIRLPPTKHFYSSMPPYKKRIGKRVPLKFIINGKPQKVYHWNLPYRKKVAEYRRRLLKPFHPFNHRSGPQNYRAFITKLELSIPKPPTFLALPAVQKPSTGLLDLPTSDFHGSSLKPTAMTSKSGFQVPQPADARSKLSAAVLKQGMAKIHETFETEEETTTESRDGSSFDVTEEPSILDRSEPPHIHQLSSLPSPQAPSSEPPLSDVANNVKNVQSPKEAPQGSGYSTKAPTVIGKKFKTDPPVQRLKFEFSPTDEREKSTLAELDFLDVEDRLHDTENQGLDLRFFNPKSQEISQETFFENTPKSLLNKSSGGEVFSSSSQKLVDDEDIFHEGRFLRAAKSRAQKTSWAN